MAALLSFFQNRIVRINQRFTIPPLQTRVPAVNHVRGNHMFCYLSQTKEHKEEYRYEVSSDPREWEFVERLMPLETVPVPREKPTYPSGWRPPKEEALKHSYYVERSKNHMLPVYMTFYNRVNKLTRIKNIHGDLWRLHDELKQHVELQVGKKIASQVNEGNKSINFKGEFVYHCEQFLLNKGF